MSPVGETLRTRCRNFPGLVNNASIDWFMPWPKQALCAVASVFLGEQVYMAGIYVLYGCLFKEHYGINTRPLTVKLIILKKENLDSLDILRTNRYLSRKMHFGPSIRSRLGLKNIQTLFIQRID